MAVLQELPYETLIQILSGLSDADLAHLCCVSSRLRAVAEPLLYKAPFLSETSTIGTNRPSAEIFLQTLLSAGRESLASHVRSLVVHRTVSLSHSPEHSPNVEFGPQSSQLVLLLHLLPSLHVLEIAPPTFGSVFTNLMESYQGTPLGTLPVGLQSLREFHCSRHNFHGMRAKTVLTLLRLPCIRSIHTSLDRHSGLITRAPSHAPVASTITDLRLSNGIPNSSLYYLLKYLTSLTHFSYCASVLDHFNIDSYMDALAPLRNTLEHLHLEFTSGRSYSDTTSSGTTFSGKTLRTWPVLRTLSCALMPLLGKGLQRDSQRLAEVLPPSLRELEILMDHYWSYEESLLQAVDLVGEKETVVPKLECLAVVKRRHSEPRLEERLTLACESAGVRYTEDCFCLAI